MSVCWSCGNNTEFINKQKKPVLLGQLYAMELDKDLLGALLETLTACPAG